MYHLKTFPSNVPFLVSDTHTRIRVQVYRLQSTTSGTTHYIKQTPFTVPPDPYVHTKQNKTFQQHLTMEGHLYYCTWVQVFSETTSPPASPPTQRTYTKRLVCVPSILSTTSRCADEVLIECVSQLL